jgi:hypothetical protein
MAYNTWRRKTNDPQLMKSKEANTR